MEDTDLWFHRFWQVWRRRFDQLENLLNRKKTERMNHPLFFDFSVNKANNTIHVRREFDADLPTVWKAWTTAHWLDLWWGPKPWRVETKTMDFREDGYWHYAMISPEGEKYWSKVSYISIQKEKYFMARDGFCDEHGKMNPSFPQNLWESVFISKGKRVEVDLLFTFDTLNDLEQTIAMNFKEGFTKGLEQLDELLSREIRL